MGQVKKVFFASVYGYSPAAVDEVVQNFRDRSSHHDPTSAPFLAYNRDHNLFTCTVDKEDSATESRLVSQLKKYTESQSKIWSAKTGVLEEEPRVYSLDVATTNEPDDDDQDGTLQPFTSLINIVDDHENSREVLAGMEHVTVYWNPTCRDITILSTTVREDITSLTGTAIYPEPNLGRVRLMGGDFRRAMQKILNLEPLLVQLKKHADAKLSQSDCNVIALSSNDVNTSVKFVRIGQSHPSYSRVIVSHESSQSILNRTLAEQRIWDGVEWIVPSRLRLENILATATKAESRIWNDFVYTAIGSLEHLQLSPQPYQQDNEDIEAADIGSEKTGNHFLNPSDVARLADWTKKVVVSEADVDRLIVDSELDSAPVRRRKVLADSDDSEDESSNAPDTGHLEAISTVTAKGKEPMRSTDNDTTMFESSRNRSQVISVPGPVPQSEQESAIQYMIDVTRVGTAAAETYLEMSRFDVEVAVDMYFQGIKPRKTPSELQPNTPAVTVRPAKEQTGAYQNTTRRRPEANSESSASDDEIHKSFKTQPGPFQVKPLATEVTLPSTTLFDANKYGSPKSNKGNIKKKLAKPETTRTVQALSGTSRFSTSSAQKTVVQSSDHKGDLADVLDVPCKPANFDVVPRWQPEELPPDESDLPLVPQAVVSAKTPSTAQQDQSLIDEPFESFTEWTQCEALSGPTSSATTGRSNKSVGTGANYVNTTNPGLNMRVQKDRALQRLQQVQQKRNAHQAGEVDGHPGSNSSKQRKQTVDELKNRRFHKTMNQKVNNPGKKSVKALKQESKKERDERLRKVKDDAYGGISPAPSGQKIAKTYSSDHIDISERKKKAMTENANMATSNTDASKQIARQKHIDLLCNGLSPPFEIARAFKGDLCFEIQLGQVLIPVLYGQDQKYYSVALCDKLFGAGRETSTTTTSFTNMITTNGADIGRLFEIKSAPKESQSLWSQENTSQQSLCYVFRCRTKNYEDFLLLVDQSGSYRLCKPESSIGAVHISFPALVWDASAILRGVSSWNNPPDAVIAEAEALARSIVVEGATNQLRIFFRQAETNEISISQVQVKRISLHNCLRPDHEQFQLQITELKNLTTKTLSTVKPPWQAVEEDYNLMVQEGNIHYEISLHHKSTNSAFTENKTLELGELTDASKTGKSLLDRDTISKLFDLTSYMLSRMDFVGIHNIGTLRRLDMAYTDRRIRLEQSMRGLGSTEMASEFHGPSGRRLTRNISDRNLHLRGSSLAPGDSISQVGLGKDHFDANRRGLGDRSANNKWGGPRQGTNDCVLFPSSGLSRKRGGLLSFYCQTTTDYDVC